MKNVKFEFYVIREDHNSKTFEMWNIFNNCVVNERTNKLCVDYKKKKMTFDDFVESLDKIIMCEEWGRCEYEVIVSSWPPRENEPGEKVDCYWQAHANIKLIAKYVLESYYPRLKISIPKKE